MKRALIAAACLYGFTLNAHAWSLFGADMNIEGRNIRVTSVNTVGEKHIFHSHDKVFDNGVYVVAVIDTNGKELPQSTAVIRNYLRSVGFKVSDKLDGSTLAIKFTIGSLNIDPDQDVVSKPDETNKTINMTGAAMMAGVKPMSSGSILLSMQSWHSTGEKVDMDSLIITDPTEAKLWDDSSVAKDAHFGIYAHTAFGDSDPKATKTDLLTLMTKVWADKYFVKD